MISNSIHLNRANKIVKWCGVDSEERYRNLVNTKYDEIKKFGWLDNEVLYKFNNYGFRCPDFTDRPSVMFLGCSHTFGLGINIEDTWSYLVHKKINLDYVNLGQDGSSNDTAFRLAYYWVPKLKPKVVFLLNPDISRCEMLYDGKSHYFFPTMDFDHSHRTAWYRDWLSEDSNSLLNSEKNLLGIKEICRSNDVKFCHLSCKHLLELRDKYKDRGARDLVHAGILTNSILSETVLSVIND